MLGIDFTSWYAVAGYIAAAYLLWRAVGGQLFADARAVKRRIWREPEPPRVPPDVTLSDIDVDRLLTQDKDQRAGGHRLETVLPSYRIVNDNPYSILDVTAGCRRSSTATGGHVFEWGTPVVRPGTHVTVHGVMVPPAMFADVHYSHVASAFVFWARFKNPDGELWEAWCDTGTHQSGWRFNPDPL
jgi:hypothetical protein